MAEEKEKQTSSADGDEGQDPSGTAVAAAQRKPQPTDRKPQQLPPYKVLLHNDDVNTFDHVVRSVMGLTPLQEEEAIQKTLEAHDQGVALLLVTHRERAELYQEQFTSLSLTVTIEPDA
jgi:ATP-dependent Clp protease adaptor protein ClpS